jgi:hypothetical protein
VLHTAIVPRQAGPAGAPLPPAHLPHVRTHQPRHPHPAQDEAKAIEQLLARQAALKLKRGDMERRIRDLGSLPAEAYGDATRGKSPKQLQRALRQATDRLKRFGWVGSRPSPDALDAVDMLHSGQHGPASLHTEHIMSPCEAVLIMYKHNPIYPMHQPCVLSPYAQTQPAGRSTRRRWTST